jgi:hypothetical protein
VKGIRMFVGRRLLGNAIKWCAVFVFVVPAVTILSQEPERGLPAAESTVTGKVIVTAGEDLVPLRGVTVRFTPPQGTRYEVSSDRSGLYSVRLPAGSYSVALKFGSCSVRRAAFELGASEKVTFDFMLPRCAIFDTERYDPPSFAEPSVDRVPRLDIPFDKQPMAYREEVIPSKSVPGRHEIVVSFGKYDNHDDSIDYYSLQFENSRATPVTVTVGTYTMLADSVTLDRRSMVFRAKGNVTLADGRGNVQHGSAVVLTFPTGEPTFQLKH